jgi:hypothetical protein
MRRTWIDNARSHVSSRLEQGARRDNIKRYLYILQRHTHNGYRPWRANIAISDNNFGGGGVLWVAQGADVRARVKNHNLGFEISVSLREKPYLSARLPRASGR